MLRCSPFDLSPSLRVVRPHRSSSPASSRPTARRVLLGHSLARPARTPRSPRPARHASAFAMPRRALQRPCGELAGASNGAAAAAHPPGRTRTPAPPRSTMDQWTSAPPHAVHDPRPGPALSRSATWPVEPATHVGPGRFAKRPLWFSVINPRSTIVQKYFELGPVFSRLAPGSIGFYRLSPNGF